MEWMKSWKKGRLVGVMVMDWMRDHWWREQ